MSAIEWADRVLRNAGFDVIRAVEGTYRLTFEDDSVIGFVLTYDSPQSIVEEWLSEQNKFLREYAFSLRRAPGKAWNVYSVFLAAQPANEIESRHLAEIEEELMATRKIVGAGLASAEDVSKALAPLLPLHSVALEHDDALKRMRSTLRVGEQTLDGLLNEVPVDDLVRLFMEEK